MASHPVQVQQGVLWLWGAGGSEEFVHSAAKSPAIAAEAEDPAWFAMCDSIAAMGSIPRGLHDNMPVKQICMMMCVPRTLGYTYLHRSLLPHWPASRYICCSATMSSSLVSCLFRKRLLCFIPWPAAWCAWQSCMSTAFHRTKEGPELLAGGY